MLPLRLTLRNFMSYGEEGGELDLRGVDLACLSGGNGHGKSTLVDAITWVLWGRSRAAREDDLLRTGTTEMEVEMEFASGGAVYRVIRKRTQRKSSSTGVLELAVRDGETYRAITGATMAETERAIGDLVRLSYDTFVNSSLLLQGKADSFTVKRPAERKEVLAEILGLQEYEVLAERARELDRGFRQQADLLEARARELDRFVAGLPALQEALLLAEAELAALAGRRAQQEALVTGLEVQSRSMASLQEQLGRMQSRLAEIVRLDAEQRSLHRQAAARLSRADDLLSDEPAIRASLAALADARRENDRLSALLGSVRDLEGQVAALRQTIAAERALLTAAHAQTRKSLEESRAATEASATRHGQLAALRQELTTLATLQGNREALALRERMLGEERAGMKERDAVLQARRTELRKKIAELRAATASCPLCSAPLDEAQRRRLLAEATSEGLAGKAEMEEHGGRLAVVERDLEATRQQQRQTATQIDRLQGLSKREGQLEQEVMALDARAALLPGLQAEEQRLRGLLEAEAYAVEERRTLQALSGQLVLLGYDGTAHQAVRGRIAELAPAEARLAALEQVHEERRAALTEIAACDLRLAGFEAEQVRLCQERDPLLEATRGLQALRAELARQQHDLAVQRGAEGALQAQIGGLRRQIEDGTARVAERAEAVLSRDAANQQAWAHRELAMIFGRRGVQAMLIENALPELEQDTNDLLSRMTDTSTQVSFITRKESKSGATETLEIRIADNMGTRNYELFSGGEAFRINLAVRIALSKLLSRRAGAELSFLLIDEGFGSQDAQGRDRLVEAISAIKEDFQKILVITHIEELKDQFDTRIEVDKGPAGSRITVVRA